MGMDKVVNNLVKKLRLCRARAQLVQAPKDQQLLILKIFKKHNFGKQMLKAMCGMRLQKFLFGPRTKLTEN